MNVHAIFIHDGKLRAVWRFLLSAVAIVVTVIAVQVLVGIAFGIAGAKPTFFLANSLAALLTLPGLLGIVAIFTRALEKRPFGSAGIAFGARWKWRIGTRIGRGNRNDTFRSGRGVGAGHRDVCLERGRG